MKILHVAESIRGGVGTYINEIAPAQIVRFGEDNVRILAPREHGGQISGVPDACKVWFPREERSVGSLIALSLELSRQIRRFKPDIVHAHSTFAGGILRAAYGWRPFRPRIVYCPHGWVWSTQQSATTRWLMERAERLLSQGCDAVVAVSEHEAQEGLRIGVPPRRMVTIVNGLNAVAPTPAPTEWRDDRRKVLFIGRLDRQKGYDLLQQAVATLEDKVSVRVVGEAVVRGMSLAPPPPNVELLGWQTANEISGQLAQADMLAMPSRWEGLPLVALEAMRAGKPVVAASVGGISEVVVDGVTGRLFAPEDFGALREALLIDSLEELAAMGRAGQERFRTHYDVARVGAQLLELYEGLVGPGRTS